MILPSELPFDATQIVYLNGQLLPLAQAQVSVLDRGFLLGDGVYEVVPFYHRRPFELDAHLARLANSLHAISLEHAPSTDDCLALIERLATACPHDDFYLYLQITRGVAKRDHAFPKPPVAPTVFAMCNPFTRVGPSDFQTGLRAIGMPDLRWQQCHIKSISLLGNVLARQAAVEQGAHEAVLFRDGFLTEGAASNIWVVDNGVLCAPEANQHILKGIRYPLLLQLAQTAGIPTRIGPITEQTVAQADELLLTAATKEVLPITVFNHRPVGTGHPGPVFQALRQGYDQLLAALTLTETP